MAFVRIFEYIMHRLTFSTLSETANRFLAFNKPFLNKFIVSPLCTKNTFVAQVLAVLVYKVFPISVFGGNGRQSGFHREQFIPEWRLSFNDNDMDVS